MILIVFSKWIKKEDKKIRLLLGRRRKCLLRVVSTRIKIERRRRKRNSKLRS
jgi:hypothetical protein